MLKRKLLHLPLEGKVPPKGAEEVDPTQVTSMPALRTKFVRTES